MNDLIEFMKDISEVHTEILNMRPTVYTVHKERKQNESRMAARRQKYKPHKNIGLIS